MRSIFFSCILAILLITAGKAHAQMPDSVKQYIDTAISIMQSRSLFGKTVRWNAVRDSAYHIAQQAKTYKDAWPALVYAFRQLKDYHGMLANEDSSFRYPPPVNFDALLSDGIKKEFLKGPRIVTNRLDNHIAYLRVPSMNVFSQADMDKMANRLRDSLCSLLGTNPRGIIIDMRMNTGGNSAPMLAGLAPLFINSTLGYGADRDDHLLSPVTLKEGIPIDDAGNKLVSVNNTCTAPGKIRIAVLIGPSTVSSGEILAAYLAQQKNVQLIGQPTAGFCNATEGFLFTNNQGYLLLSVNRIANARRFIYRDMIVRPRIQVKAADNYDDLSADPTVKAALKWLRR